MPKMKTMIRCNALDMSSLAAQEAHGKREDRTSQMRRIRDAAPLVAGGLDLRPRYDKHVDGARQNKGAKKPVLHFIVRFPPELLDLDAKHFSGNKIERQRMMLRQAVAFINATHGGDAVFAARIDRDEEGETIADVFAAPRYEKRTKRTKPDEQGAIWSSATKFGKDLAMKHQAEIQRRHPDAKGDLTGPRHVGIALNSEWRSWFKRVNDVDLASKIEKESAAPDRLEIEALKKVEAARDDLDDLHQKMKKERASFDRLKDRVVGLVRAFGETFGLPLPKSLRAAVTALEDELEDRKPQADDPFSNENDASDFEPT